MYRCLASVFVLAITAAPALACRGGWFETRVLLDSIPPAAANSPILAKVEITGYEPWVGGPKRVARARVIEAIKGTKAGHFLLLPAGRQHSCGGGVPEAAMGTQAYIAGELKGGIFRGEWSEYRIQMLEKQRALTDAP
jgi:hypothetical protein